MISSLSRRSLFAAVLLLLPLRAVAAEKAVRPNLVLILMDDMGYGDVGPFNANTKNRTPHLDRMAREGMKLHLVFTPHRFARRRAPRCLPAATPSASPFRR